MPIDKNMNLQHLFTLVILVSSSQQASLNIVSMKGAHGAEPCATTCVGTTGRATGGTWIQYNTAEMGITVDMSACEFISTPIITTSLDGSTTHAYMVGTTSLYWATKDAFRIFLSGLAKTANKPDESRKLTTDDATNYEWNINWSATGYTC